MIFNMLTEGEKGTEGLEIFGKGKRRWAFLCINMQLQTLQVLKLSRKCPSSHVRVVFRMEMVIPINYPL